MDLPKFFKSDTFWSSFASMSEGFEQTAYFALLDTTRLMIWWSVLEFGLEIFIPIYVH
jgi:hypothetical protein